MLPTIFVLRNKNFKDFFRELDIPNMQQNSPSGCQSNQLAIIKDIGNNTGKRDVTLCECGYHF